MSMKKLVCLVSFGLFGFSMFTGDFALEAQSQVAKRKWSHRKKDAVIGGAAGAATGAIVSKNKTKGAVIGGAVGATAGYLHGKRKDRREGTKN